MDGLGELVCGFIGCRWVGMDVGRWVCMDVGRWVCRCMHMRLRREGKGRAGLRGFDR